MARAASPSEDLGVVPTSWQIAGTGDFNGDGESVFYGATPMATRPCGIPMARAASPIRTWASPDELADRRDRRLHREAVKTAFCGATPTAIRPCGTPTARAASPAGSGRCPTSWQIAGTGDFTGTGQDSILWRKQRRHGLVESQWLGRLHRRGSGRRSVPAGRLSGPATSAASGQSGIAWRNTNGDTALWNPNGAGGFTGEDLALSPPAGMCTKFSLEMTNRVNDPRCIGNRSRSKARPR